MIHTFKVQIKTNCEKILVLSRILVFLWTLTSEIPVDQKFAYLLLEVVFWPLAVV